MRHVGVSSFLPSRLQLHTVFDEAVLITWHAVQVQQVRLLLGDERLESAAAEQTREGVQADPVLDCFR